MDVKIDFIDFAKKVNEKYLDALNSPAKRMGLTGENAAKLVKLIYESLDSNDPNLSELERLGFVEQKNGKFFLTSKGGIVAKSFERVKYDFNNAFSKNLTDNEKQAFLSIISKF